MRVTNGMIINSTLNGLYTNMNQLNKTYGQMTSGKKIQTVSDDPIIAGRALKLTTNVLETAQYRSNTKAANSWMEVTEGSLKNITSILKSIHTKCNQAATGTLETKDKEKIYTDIAQLCEQLNQEANTTYSGRYVFSGYRTSEPLVLTKPYETTEDMTLTDSMVMGDKTVLKGGSVIKSGSYISQGTTLAKDTAIASGGEMTLGAGTVLDNADDVKELVGIDLVAGEYTFDCDTKLAKGTRLTHEQAVEIQNKTGYPAGTLPAGDVVLADDITITKNTHIKNDVSKALFNKEYNGTYTTTVEHKKASPAQLKGNVTFGKGSSITGDTTVGENTTLAKATKVQSGSVIKTGSKLGAGTLNPKVLGKIDGDKIDYEIGVNSTINVNVNGMDKIMQEIHLCVNDIPQLLEKALSGDSVSSEELHNLFTGKLNELSGLLQEVSDVTSDLGSRMKRIDYTEGRLDEQSLTFSNLLTQTEDIDIEEVYTKFNVQYATYQSALQATSKIITNTLADYL